MRKLFILFIAMCAFSLAAVAATSYAPTKKQFRFGADAWKDDASTACSGHAAINTAANPSLNWSMTSTPVSPDYKCGLTAYYANGAGVASGPNYYTLESRIVCNNGSLPVNGLCTDETPKKCETPSGSVVTWTQKTGHAADANAVTSDAGSRAPYPESSPACSISSVPSVKQCYSVAASGGGADFYCTFSAVSDGKDASASTAPSDAGNNKPTDSKPTQITAPPDSKGNCPGGTVQAGVDSSGIPVCVGTGTNPQNSSSQSTTTAPTTTTTAADGTKTSINSQSTTNSDGSVTVKTTTTVTSPDGTVKTSTSTNTGNNSSGGGGKSDDSKDFCTANPGLTICQNSSVSGSCGQTACQGDAIQCATLRAAAAMQCAQQQDIDALKASPQKALGDQILSGADPMNGQISDTLKGTDVDMSRVSFDQSGFLGGGTCLANRSFVVLGQVVPVDFSNVCNNIAPLRAVMMAVALIMAYLIVGRSVVGS